MIALYRITHDGWPSEQAKAEAKRYGMHPWEVAMKNYIHDFYLRPQREAARFNDIAECDDAAAVLAEQPSQ